MPFSLVIPEHQVPSSVVIIRWNHSAVGRAASVTIDGKNAVIYAVRPMVQEHESASRRNEIRHSVDDVSWSAHAAITGPRVRPRCVAMEIELAIDVEVHGVTSDPRVLPAGMNRLAVVSRTAPEGIDLPRYGASKLLVWKSVLVLSGQSSMEQFINPSTQAGAVG